MTEATTAGGRLVGACAGSTPTIWLASRSPRRRQLMLEAGFDARVVPADIDDGRLPHGDARPESWVMALAYLKARRVAEMLSSAFDAEDVACGVVLGADTVCALDREILGQPRDEGEAERMLRLMRGREHRTLTGVCLLPLREWLAPAGHTRFGSRLLAFDAAHVSIGETTDRQIQGYLSSGEWRGKAGAYNLNERIQAGWPIACRGDPTTVMGLPMKKLAAWLAKVR